jgi:hypothetical protein
MNELQELIEQSDNVELLIDLLTNNKDNPLIVNSIYRRIILLDSNISSEGAQSTYRSKYAIRHT